MRIETEDGWVKVADATGSLVIGALSDSVVYMRLHGKMRESFFAPASNAIDSMLAATPLLAFVDGETWTGYEPAYREAVTRWFKDHVGAVSKVHILVHSPLVRMGMQVVNLAIGQLLDPYADRIKFEIEMARLVPDFFLAL